MFKRIKELREDTDTKQQTIADLLGISQQQYSLYENEYREFKIIHLIKIADYYHTTIDYLVGRTDKK